MPVLQSVRKIMMRFMKQNVLFVVVWAMAGVAASLAAEPIPAKFFSQHCYECHDKDTKKGNLDLTALKPDFSDPDTFARWVKVHDRITAGEMPPKKKARPSADESRAWLGELDAKLAAADAARVAREGRVRMRRMTRAEFENTLADLLALPRLDIQALLPADGTVGGFDKIASGLDLSPAHLAAYAEAAEKALDAGGGFEDKKGYAGDAGPDLEERKRLYKDNKVAQSRSAVGLLNPNLAGYEAAMNVAPIFAGLYRMRLSLWGFQWNQGKPEPCAAPQAAVLRAHEEGKQQEGGRLLSAFTAPSLESNEQEITTWLEAHESIVVDPVSVPWLGLRIGQIAGRAAKHVGPGVALDWFEIEGPLNPTWPP
ncbi:MAG: DUF1587 domain-containing protein, partial [Proteobacteria bacterium]|nr:DUF1587 domain-containing protein [Pseudomonadota bacterium]